MPHAKFRADRLKIVAVHKEQRTDRQADSYNSAEGLHFLFLDSNETNGMIDTNVIRSHFIVRYTVEVWKTAS